MLITVFTPAYNRGDIIEKLYRSLRAQKSKDFEWVVVDDGSVDNTAELFSVWRDEENFFPITYIKTENGGKHRAVNRGVNMAKGELFFIVDSDDALTSAALEMVAYWHGAVKGAPGFGGVAGLKGYTLDKAIGNTHKNGKDYLDITSLERDKHNVKGDKAEVFKTELLRRFPFKEFPGEKFLTENTVWYEIAGAGYKLRFFNEVIYICEYLEDGLMRNSAKLAAKNLEGESYMLKIYNKHKKLSFKNRLDRYAYIYSIARYKKIPAKVIAKKLNCSVLFLKIGLFLRVITGKGRYRG